MKIRDAFRLCTALRRVIPEPLALLWKESAQSFTSGTSRTQDSLSPTFGRELGPKRAGVWAHPNRRTISHLVTPATP